MNSVQFRSQAVTLDTLIAEASTSYVYRASSHGQPFAVKRVPLENDALKEAFRKEVQVLTAVGRHPNIIALVDCAQIGKDGMLLLEWCSGGNLKTSLKYKELTESQVLRHATDLAGALLHIHSKGVIHRDLRPENVLLGDSGLKLADFGSAAIEDELISMQLSQLESDIHRNVPPHYRSPEQIRYEKQNDKSDVWQLGCFLYSLLFKENAFSIKDPQSQLRGVFRPFRKPVANSWEAIFQMLFEPDLYRRASVRDFLQYIHSASVPDALPYSQSAPSLKFAVVLDLLDQSEEVWVRAATLNTEGPPDPHFTQKILMQIWKSPESASAFFAAVNNRPVLKTVVALKTLMLVHRVLYSCPEAVFYTDPSAAVPLSALLAQWTPEALAARPGDYMRCEYFAGLIRMMARVLIDKTKLHRLHHCRGNWMLEKISDQEQVLEIMEYWKRLTRISNGLYAGVDDLAETRAALAKQLLIEQYRIVHVISNSLTKESLQSFIMAFEATRALVGRLRSLIADLNLPDLDPNIPLRLIQAIAPQHQVPEVAKLPVNSNARAYLEEPKQDKNYSTSGGVKRNKRDLTPSPQARRDRSPPSRNAGNLIDMIGAQPSAPLMPPPEIRFEDSKPRLTEEFALDPRWLVTMDELKCGDLLGMGSSCSVYKGFYRRTRVAIKMLRNTQATNLTKEFYREIAAMSRLRHPNLVLFMGACVSPSMCIVSEFCAGESLFKLLHEQKNVMLSWKQRLQMAKDTAMGMCYLHESKPPILHRDLKSLNLLLKDPVTSASDPVCVKITDFGVARLMEANTHLTGQTGTPHWMAPEVISNKPYSLKADVYSFGIVLWEICARDIPYKHLHPMAIPLRVSQAQERPNLSIIASSCPPKMKDLIVRCWQHEPARRPDFEEVLDVLESIDCQ